MNNDKHILVVEDDPKLGTLIKNELISNGFPVTLAKDGREAVTCFNNAVFCLVVLDINLPYMNGWEVCKHFRSTNKNIPIIMLTALGELQDKIDAFEKGADDYLVKPFHFTELLARIKVFLKRNEISAHPEAKVRVGDLEMDVDEKKVTRNGIVISLTVKEFALLALLMRNVGKVISKTEIAEKVWNINFDTGTNTIEVYINFLRNKIDKPYKKALIHTKTGFGYYIEDNVSA
ncbi:MAG: response regulator transcription factor [Bacteroidia bacterium]|nr:response regulator transcription factor [Bacteroidia bacterium]